MVQFFDHIPNFLRDWIQLQKVFWVATAPLSDEGHVNLSPKGGHGTFHIVDEHTVWYEDLTGSGVETISHLRENGRITILFNAFEGPPRLARLFGRGVVHEFDTPEYNALIPYYARRPGSRAVIMITVHKVSTSCGYAVPFLDYLGERTRLDEFAVAREIVDNASHSPELASKGLKSYWQTTNAKSIDGLPGIQTAFKSTKRFNESKNEDRSKSLGKTASKPFMKTMLVGILAFSAGVILSTRVHHITERVGMIVLT